jgi:ATPase subunit of ABC transporter with duplicated ATPase domains
MLTLQHIAYAHPNRDELFDNISLSLAAGQKIALVGNNGTGKSTLLRIIAGELIPSSGTIQRSANPYYVPQHFGQFNELSIAQALRINDKLQALAAIVGGDMNEQNLAMLDDDWNIEERSIGALSRWGLDRLDLNGRMDGLSGGEKTKVFLSGIAIHQPALVLLDEPTNHLDDEGRKLLYEYICSAKETLITVSHDRQLLNLLPEVCELSTHGIAFYGGTYDFYAAQKLIEATALAEDLRGQEKELRKAKEIERKAIERKQKLDARGKKKQERAGIPTIAMNTLRNKAEKSTARMKDVHSEKIGSISEDVARLRKELPDADKMKLSFDNAALHRGKMLVKAKEILFDYDGQPAWKEALSFVICSGQRLAIKGRNGSGKTTLVRAILNDIKPSSGQIERAALRAIYIDQDYSLINDMLTIYEQAQTYNAAGLREHEVKSRLTRFLFTSGYWDHPCSTLSGGEKMRLVLCCLTLSDEAPDMIILDEPTNNLDIQSTEILTAALNEYRGTLLAISHDRVFLDEIGIDEVIDLD